MHGSRLLRRWRNEQGLSINAAARMLGFGFKEYRAWETAQIDPPKPTTKNPRGGRPRRPGLEAADVLLRVCGIPISSWLEEIDAEDSDAAA